MSFVHNQPEYSVSEIAGHLKRVVEDTFGYVRVRGEISKASVNAASGHCYLSLKDDKAVLDAVCWKGTMGKLAHKPVAGMEMIATGKLTTYPGSSKYQLVIESLEPAGVGALMAMLEARKRALEAEGLFKSERKRPLPFLPERIGIVTSPTGAVIRDMLHRLADRFPRQVYLWAVPVQGQGAAEKIAEAIAGFNALPVFGESSGAGTPSPEGEGWDEGIHAPKVQFLSAAVAQDRPSPNPLPRERAIRAEAPSGVYRPDVIIVARGGGSIEDLWAFNEEVVVRAAAASDIPLISAVGHETDTTLIDYAADKRAPTPTAAAELAVPVRENLIAWVEQAGVTMNASMMQMLRRYHDRVRDLARGLPRPQQLVATMAQALDSMAERLQEALPRSLQLRHEKLQRLAAGLSPRLLREMMLREQQRVQHLGAMLESLNVLGVLKRGFALVKDASGQVVKAASAMPENAALTLQFHDGERVVTAGNAAAGGAGNAAAKLRSKKASTPVEPGLFD